MAYLYTEPVEEAAITPPVEVEAFRFAMRELVSGVAIVTTGQGAARNGCTATSLCSLSLEPPSLIVCLTRASATLKAIRREGVFGISLLSEAHADLADRFAGRGGLRGAARFEGCDVATLSTGSPMLQGAVAMIDCEVEETIERHTHAIVIGRVVAAKAAGGRPLLHWRGRSLRSV